MPDPHFEKTQVIACLLLVLALIALAIADHYNMRDLANGATMVLGTGSGILVGKYTSQSSTKSGDIVNTTTNPSDVPPSHLG